MEPDDIKKELQHAISGEEEAPEEEDPFTEDGLGHAPAPEDDRGGGE